MKILSVFVDESGMYGSEVSHYAPYYIVTLVLHDQAVDIYDSINEFQRKMAQLGRSETVIHTGRLIRREEEYRDMLLLERKQIFNVIYNFARTVDVKYHSFMVEKKHVADDVELSDRLSKQLSSFLNGNLESLLRYDKIVVYYDYGQNELTKLLVSSFNTAFKNVEIRKTQHSYYRLFNAADMFCTLELLSIKAERNQLSNSEIKFFKSAKLLTKAYLRAVATKRFC
ncbi:MAG: hypothetical protein FWD44_04510 [Oscillospiraceae bacterium]|nr:hypothetical protein [Oscillospiraceae bacterium]